MDYYGGNDYRDYLAHYGVVGMRWGIRRYQPYSYTGSRKGGKTGKEIGLAGKLGRGAKAAGDVGVKVGKAVAKGTKAVVKGVKEVAGNVAEAKREKERRYLIDQASPSEIMAKRNKLSDRDVQEAINRIRNNNTLRQLESDENRAKILRGKQAIDDMVNLGKTVVSVADTASSIAEKMGAAKKKRDADVKQLFDNREWDKLDKRSDLKKEEKAELERQKSLQKYFDKGDINGLMNDPNFREKDLGRLKNLAETMTKVAAANKALETPKPQTPQPPTSETQDTYEKYRNYREDNKDRSSWYDDDEDRVYTGRRKRR